MCHDTHVDVSARMICPREAHVGVPRALRRRPCRQELLDVLALVSAGAPRPTNRQAPRKHAVLSCAAIDSLTATPAHQTSYIVRAAQRKAPDKAEAWRSRPRGLRCLGTEAFLASSPA
ncbi:hypothetical protein VTN00DRAFT_4981 [Thermoascus crustaceus]|uniref:uncharacterized protein n=1 Tax=Thermoascus crustaceus TaxID=5088 RepID=UPI0037422218